MLRNAAAATAARLLSQPPSPPGERPKILWQKWNERECVPNAVFEQARVLAPEYEHALLDDADSDRFVRERLGSAVAQRYPALAKTQRADLLRFGLLLHYGGVWLDVDAPMVIPLDAVFPDRLLSYSAYSAFAGIMLGLMASPPGLPIYREALDDVVRTAQVHVDREPIVFTKHFEQLLKKQRWAGWVMHQERCLHRKRRNDSLAQCAGMWESENRFGYCCWIESAATGQVLMKKQWADYLRRGGQKDFARGPCANRSRGRG